MEWDGFSPAGEAIYTLAAGFKINDQFGSYAELFGFIPEQAKARHHAAAGFKFLPKQNFQLDISAAANLKNSEDDYYVSFGISWLFKR